LTSVSVAGLAPHSDGETETASEVDRYNADTLTIETSIRDEHSDRPQGSDAGILAKTCESFMPLDESAEETSETQQLADLQRTVDSTGSLHATCTDGDRETIAQGEFSSLCGPPLNKMFARP
jgi:hypothetical protein